MLQPIINRNIHTSVCVCVWRRPVRTCAAGMDFSGLACVCVAACWPLAFPGLHCSQTVSVWWMVWVRRGQHSHLSRSSPVGRPEDCESVCVCVREFMCVMSRRLTVTLWRPKQPDSARWHHHWGSAEPPPSHTHTHFEYIYMLKMWYTHTTFFLYSFLWILTEIYDRFNCKMIKLTDSYLSQIAFSSKLTTLQAGWFSNINWKSLLSVTTGFLTFFLMEKIRFTLRQLLKFENQ